MTAADIVDPSDAPALAPALAIYLRAHLGREIALTTPPTPIGQGFDTYIYTFRIDSPELPPAWDRDLILRLYGSAEQSAKCEREAAIQRFAAAKGFPAVEPLAAEGIAPSFGLPVMIMPRIPGGALLDIVKARPHRARRLLREMGRLHARLHALTTAGAPLPYDEPLINRILAESRERMEGVGASRDITAMEEGYRWLDARRSALAEEEPVLCHNDYHPLNILLDNDARMHVIDWSNAALGDRHCDAARTIGVFWFAQIVATSAVERLLLRAVRGFLRNNYLNGYRESATLDSKCLALWETVHTFGAWTQLEELAVTRAAGTSTTAMAQQIPPTMIATARERFWKLATDGG